LEALIVKRKEQLSGPEYTNSPNFPKVRDAPLAIVLIWLLKAQEAFDRAQESLAEAREAMADGSRPVLLPPLTALAGSHDTALRIIFKAELDLKTLKHMMIALRPSHGKGLVEQAKLGIRKKLTLKF
jgi:hypothetical protein